RGIRHEQGVVVLFMYTDKILTCSDCSQEFTFTASEQQIVDALDAANTWADAVAAADAMLAVDAAKWQKEKQQSDSEGGEAVPSDGEGETSESQSSDSQNGEGESKQESGNTKQDGG
ncbi:MAG: zinc-ribbon domain containing protein, partial [bacterium]